jgi:anti-repressor protein
MDELITIKKTEGIETVNARELWEKLKSKREFANWIKDRVELFIEGADFIIDKIVKVQIEGNREVSRPVIEYYLTIDTAKHLAMLERNEIGRKIRQYFIDFEKRNQAKIPQTYAEALRLCADQVEQIEAQKQALQIAQPKVEFHDAVTQSSNTLDIAQIAKLLANGYGRNQLFAELRSRKIFMRNNQPYQRYVDLGYFKIVESTFVRGNGSVGVRTKTVAFQRGIEFIMRELSK